MTHLLKWPVEGFPALKETHTCGTKLGVFGSLFGGVHFAPLVGSVISSLPVILKKMWFAKSKDLVIMEICKSECFRIWGFLASYMGIIGS